MTTDNADDEHDKGASMTAMIIESTNMACAGMLTCLKYIFLLFSLLVLL
jgi:hypothetical protein